MEYFKLVGLFAILFLASCTYNTEEELYATEVCDTMSMSYSNDVVPILTNYTCLSCHSSTNSQGSVNLQGYSNVKIWIDNGILLKSILHDGASPMPKGQSQMSTCDIDKITSWISDGAQDN